LSQQINLFNPVFFKQKKVLSAAAMVQALGLVLAGTLAIAFYGNQAVADLQKKADAGSEQLARRQARLAKAHTEFAPRQQSKELELQLAEAEAQLHAMHQVEGVLERGEMGNTDGYSEYFKALARQNTSGLWLTGISIAGAGNEIGVQGRALEATLVPTFIGRLAQERVMRGKAFGSLQISQAEPGKAAPASYVEFSLQSAAGAANK
jgi:hypothetical protein